MNKLVVSDIKSKIHTIRGEQVILDSDLANLYNVKTRILNQAIKRNKERFPKGFMFQLNNMEYENLKSQIVTSSWGGRRHLPYAFTEQGVAMLSGILKSDTAIKISIQIMRAFVFMRRFISSNANIFSRIESVERKQITFEMKTEENFEKIFDALEKDKVKRGIFYEGQMFEAYEFVCGLIKKAENEIILIDNYVDESVLTLFSKRNKDVKVKIYTKSSKELKLDVEKFNSQYNSIEIIDFNKSHDRFLIIDSVVYHFGASLKDLGKKWFAFSKFENFELLNKLRNT